MDKRADRFWAKVEKSDGCWVWVARRDRWGYGQFMWKSYTNIRAHRVSWMLTYGAIPDSLFVLHKCDNPPCVRPDHLFLGTPLTNAQDRDAKGRGNYVRCQTRPDSVVRGEKHGQARLTLEQVKEIRKLYAEGAMIQRELSVKFGISLTQINRIVNRKKWANLG